MGRMQQMYIITVFLYIFISRSAAAETTVSLLVYTELHILEAFCRESMSLIAT